jgi:hypothetical protein
VEYWPSGISSLFTSINRTDIAVGGHYDTQIPHDVITHISSSKNVSLTNGDLLLGINHSDSSMSP